VSAPAAAADAGRARATAYGFAAILLWAALALLTVGTGDIPPFQLSALCFAIGGALGLGWVAARGGSMRAALRQPVRVWALGVSGLFGYHFAYFSALKAAPPAQASLIAYLWPLLIVLFSGLLPGERLRAAHVAGALLAFGGALLIVAPAALGGVAAAHAAGYGFAAACALIWSGYSVLSRRVGEAPTEAVAGFCLVTAALSALCSAATETPVAPAPEQWAAIVALGLGPVGAAFYAWDAGMKRGDIQLLGVAAYAAPLLSTLALVLAGAARATPSLLAAAALIAGGAALAALGGRRRGGARQ
jgi:drug/metabolite transporter (DMT)-like permease